MYTSSASPSPAADEYTTTSGIRKSSARPRGRVAALQSIVMIGPPRRSFPGRRVSLARLHRRSSSLLPRFVRARRTPASTRAWPTSRPLAPGHRARVGSVCTAMTWPSCARAVHLAQASPGLLLDALSLRQSRCCLRASGWTSARSTRPAADVRGRDDAQVPLPGGGCQQGEAYWHPFGRPILRPAATTAARTRGGVPMSLFEHGLAEQLRARGPLASRLRPTSLDEVVGQDHLLGRKGALRALVDARRLTSVILWGPAGTGKTTIARLLAEAVGAEFESLSAVSAGVKDVREAAERARRRLGENGVATVLLLDFTAHLLGVRLARSRALRAVWDTPLRALCTSHSRREHRHVYAAGRPQGATREPSRRPAFLRRARLGHRFCPWPF